VKILAIGHSLHPEWFGGEPRVARIVLNALKDQGHDVRVIALPRQVIKWRLRSSALSVDPVVYYYERALRRFKPDVVLLWYDATLDSAVYLLKYARELGYRLVYSLHYHHMWCPDGRFFCLYERGLACEKCIRLTLFRRIDYTRLYLKQFSRKLNMLRGLLRSCREYYRVVVPSRFMGILVHVVLGVPMDNIVVVYNGVDVDFFKPIADKEDKPPLLFVGALERHKGFHHYLMLVRELRRRGYDVNAYAVGKGSLANLATKYGIQYLGQVKDMDLVRLYSKSWAVIIPSLWSEPFPLVPLEAASCGTVPIAYSVGGLNESCGLVKGVLIPRGSLTKLMHTVEKLLSSGVYEAKKRGMTCRAKVVVEFNVHKMIEGYVNSLVK